jgi:hypothetical protein
MNLAQWKAQRERLDRLIGLTHSLKYAPLDALDRENADAAMALALEVWRDHNALRPE